MLKIDGNRAAIIKCPNKSNPYHQCTDWCARRWGTTNATYLSNSQSQGNNSQSQGNLCKIL